MACKESNGGSVIHPLMPHLGSAPSDAEEILLMLKEYGLDVHQRNDNGRSAIFDACNQTDTSALEMLIKHGASVNDQAMQSVANKITYRGRRRYGGSYLGSICEKCTLYTPLHEAAQKNLLYGKVDLTVKMVQLLLDHGADVNAKDSLGYTPLMRCVKHQTRVVDIGSLLLKMGSNPNEMASDGCTPLILAVLYNKDFTQILLDAGADGNTVFKGYNQNCTPLQCAIQSSQSQYVIEAILERTDEKYLNHKGVSSREAY